MSVAKIDGAPVIQGLGFRTFAGSADVIRLAEVREACRARDRVDRLSSMEIVPT